MADGRRDWLYESLLGKIGELGDAIAELEKAPDRLAQGELRRRLSDLRAQHVAAPAALEADELRASSSA